MTVLGAGRGRGHADTAARRRTWITRPGTYLVILFAQRYLVGGLVGAIRG